MIRLVESCVRDLPLHVVARRAVDETMADWRHEVAEARHPFGRLAAGGRGLLAVAVVLGRAAASETLTWAAWRTAATMVVISAALTAANVTLGPRTEAGPPVLTFYGIVPAAMPLFMLILCAAPPVRRSQTTALVGASVVMGAVVFLLVAWLVPLASQAQANVARSWLAGQGVILPAHTPDVWELPLPAVARVALEAGWDSGPAVIRINTIVALSVMPPLFVWLGLAARRLSTALRYPRLGYPLAVACGVSVFAVAEALMRASVPWGDASTFARALVEVVTFWSHVAVAVAEAVALSWLAEPRTRGRLRRWARI